MSAPYDIVAYTYNADLYCPECIVDVVIGHEPAFHLDPAEMQLDMLAKNRGIDRQDEASFDSGEFPKVVFRDMLDFDVRCGRCGHKLEGE